MKKIKYTIILVSSLLLAGCSESFLEKEPTSTFLAENLFTSESKATIAVNGCYNAMATFYVNNLFIHRECFTDNASRYDGDMFEAINPDYAYSNDFWNKLYTMVARCNYAINGISSMDNSFFKSGIKERSLGECLSLRALAYHELIFRFGDVPLITELTGNLEAMKVARTPKSQVLIMILKDLDDAIGYLPSVTTYKGTSNVGRVSKEAAIALKARVLLFNGMYAEAATEAKKVINASPAPFKLTTNYQDNFVKTGNNNDESVLVIGRISGNTPSLGLSFNDQISPKSAAYIATNGTAYNMVIQDLVDEFELKDGTRAPVGQLINTTLLGDARDSRLKASVLYKGAPSIGLFVFNGGPNSDSKSAYANRKYLNVLDGVGSNDIGQNMNIIRYADVLLMAAEGLIESNGNLSEAVGYINQIRARAGQPIISAGTQAQMREALRHERRVEMAMEGFREYDIVRWRIAESVIPKKFNNKDGLDGRNKNEPFSNSTFLGSFVGWNNLYYLWPIPGAEFIKNPNLGNGNNGY